MWLFAFAMPAFVTGTVLRKMGVEAARANPTAVTPLSQVGGRAPSVAGSTLQAVRVSSPPLPAPSASFEHRGRRFTIPEDGSTRQF